MLQQLNRSENIKKGVELDMTNQNWSLCPKYIIRNHFYLVVSLQTGSKYVNMHKICVKKSSEVFEKSLKATNLLCLALDLSGNILQNFKKRK